MRVRIPEHFSCVSHRLILCAQCVSHMVFFSVSAVYPKDCGSRNCTEGTKIWRCRNFPHPKIPPPPPTAPCTCIFSLGCCSGGVSACAAVLPVCLSPLLWPSARSRSGQCIQRPTTQATQPSAPHPLALRGPAPPAPRPSSRSTLTRPRGTRRCTRTICRSCSRSSRSATSTWADGTRPRR